MKTAEGKFHDRVIYIIVNIRTLTVQFELQKHQRPKDHLMSQYVYVHTGNQLKSGYAGNHKNTVVTRLL